MLDGESDGCAHGIRRCIGARYAAVSGLIDLFGGAKTYTTNG